MQCACCGEAEVEFLGIDHIDGDGAQHRREVRPSAIYRWLIKNKFPTGIQILCSNCNLAKGFYGSCPHQDRDGSYPVKEGMQTASDNDGLGSPASSNTLVGQASGSDVMSRNDRRNVAAVALSRLGASKGGRAR